MHRRSATQPTGGHELTRSILFSALAFPLAAAALVFAVGCSNDEDGHQSREGAGEHSGRSGESGEGGGQQHSEEDGTQLTKAETYDHTRNGARLILAYSTGDNTFTGSVENTTNTTLTRVRIEVHLSNGIELGPTTPGDLGAGQSRQITLAASDEPFETWSAHPEVGQEEANHQSDREARERGG